MIKAAIFDLDGTLLDRDASLALFIDEQYERMISKLGHIPKSRYIERFIKLDARGYRWKDEVYQQLIKEFNIEGISWEILLDDYVSRFQNHCVPFCGLVEMLEALKSRSLRLGIITNGPGQLQFDNIRALGIESHFDVILISGVEGISKPDPRIFLKALSALGVKAEEALYVGDHPGNDVKAAKAVGMVSVWKKDSQYETAEADYVIQELNEVIKIVEKREIEICLFDPDDTEELLNLFYETIHSVNAADYSPQQLTAWAPEEMRKEKLQTWSESLSRNKTYVAKSGDKIIGFCDLADDGYLNRLYVHKDYQRQGIANKLIAQIEQEANRQGQKEIRTQASITAKPFFESRGFKLIRKQVVARQGVELENYLMAKYLNPY